MIAKIYSAIPQGYIGSLITVEGDTNQGLPSFNIVGMANKTISEARERVRAAITNSGFSFPTKKLTINLAPAELIKDGSHLDLPIAVAILVLSEQLLPKDALDTIFVGELALDGELKPVRGIINVVEAAKIAHYHRIVVPFANLAEAQLIPGIQVVGLKSLQDLVLHLKGLLPTPQINNFNTQTTSPLKSADLYTDFNTNVVKNTQTPVRHPIRSIKQSDVVENTETEAKSDPITHITDIIGQDFAKRALEIALAGHHNLLLSGPPGSGKSLLAQSAITLMPPPSPEEFLEIAKIHSLSESSSHHYRSCPFRAPHHTASATSIIGGGPHLSPGEISLAHRGILFLDEFPEFPRNVIESLRQPLESHNITVARASGRATYPANFILIATMNPCPCGHLNDPYHECTCSAAQISAYHKRISGPILDRFDLTIVVRPLHASEISSHTPTSSTSVENVVKNNITEAKITQSKRYHDTTTYNGHLTPSEIKHFIQLSSSAESLLLQATEKFHLSTRSYFKIIKIARTIADLDHSKIIENDHISEALSFRQKPF